MPDPQHEAAIEAWKRAIDQRYAGSIPPQGRHDIAETFLDAYDAALRARGRGDRCSRERPERPQRCDFEKGWRAGVEWAEEHGESSMVKWFVDQDAAARASNAARTPQDVLDSDGEQVRYAETKEFK